MKKKYWITVVAAGLSAFAAPAMGAQAPRGGALTEAYVREPVPTGIKTVISKTEGPVYVDANGHTLYQWPRKELRNGGTADMKGAASACENVKTTENVGLMSPYPPGLILPDVETRKTCEQMWPPALAADDAKPVGKWSIMKRRDGRNQWAYDGFVLYTSSMDKKPGDTIGGTKLGRRSIDPSGSLGGDAPAYRIPIGPTPDIPGQFAVEQNLVGRQITLVNGYTVYSWDGDRPNKSNCDAACLKNWKPVLAPEVGVMAREAWSVIERSPGVRQWAFRGSPLYTYVHDPKPGNQHGVDVSGWNTVFTQKNPAAPPEFTQQDSAAGVVLADSKGKTIYIYHCGDDAADQLLCDHPDTPQEYRYAVCGAGSQARCLTTFPYVIAMNGATGANEAWTVKAIDPATGKSAKPGQADALQVWAYRDRPVFTFSRDERPGAVRAHTWGEFYGLRNGYTAFFLREEFMGR
jgi:predicted lipoprotein with Yx(FWY)xxD motif